MTTQKLRVFVPDEGALAHIARASAIVGADERDGHILIHFEGNLYGAVNLVRFIDRVSLAAGRLTRRYPTVAKALAPVDHLVEVGSYDVDKDEVTVTRGAALAAWLGMTEGVPSKFGSTDTV